LKLIIISTRKAPRNEANFTRDYRILPSLAQDKMLLGEISKSDLQQAPFSTWYTENESGYQVDAAAIEGLESLLEGVEIKIGMAHGVMIASAKCRGFIKFLIRQGLILSRQQCMHSIERNYLRIVKLLQ